MRLPVEWIREYAPVPLSRGEIAERLTMAGLEVESLEETEAGAVLDIKVTPNRGDCLSALGVARELAAACDVPYQGGPDIAPEGAEAHGIADRIQVHIEEPDLCARYAARVIEGLRIGVSPDWMQRRLIDAGMRPISNIVDVTNYVMLVTGQPLHAFDLSALHGPRIVVRRARDGESLMTLDGTLRSLTADMLVIADAAEPVAIAGVMGGRATEVTDRTSTALLESANFRWQSVRRTARTLGMNTEASYRFERGVDPEGVAYAADLACQLLAEIGAGSPLPGIVDVYPGRQEIPELSLRSARCAALIGYAPTDEEIVRALSALGYAVQRSKIGVFAVRRPSWRSDVEGEIDVIEDVARVLGYERIPERLPSGATTFGSDTEASRMDARVRRSLIGSGLTEARNHTMLAPDPLDESLSGYDRISVRSALSADLSGLRRSLLPGLYAVLDRNARRGQGPLAFFETGAIFGQDPSGVMIEEAAVAAIICGPLHHRSWVRDAVGKPSFFVGRGIVERLALDLDLEFRFEPSSDARFHPGRQARILLDHRTVGIVGELPEEVSQELRTRDRCVVMEIRLTPILDAVTNHTVRYQPPARFPAIARDLAPRLPLDVSYARVHEVVEAHGRHLLEDIRVTDVYTGPPLGEGLKSLTLSLTFRSSERTLTDSEVDDALSDMRQSMVSSFGATFQEA